MTRFLVYSWIFVEAHAGFTGQFPQRNKPSSSGKAGGSVLPGQPNRFLEMGASFTSTVFGGGLKANQTEPPPFPNKPKQLIKLAHWIGSYIFPLVLNIAFWVNIKVSFLSLMSKLGGPQLPCNL